MSVGEQWRVCRSFKGLFTQVDACCHVVIQSPDPQLSAPVLRGRLVLPPNLRAALRVCDLVHESPYTEPGVCEML